MKTPEPTFETDSARQLREVAAAIETYRADLGMSVAALLRDYPELGTDKTYGKITKGDFSELKIDERWLPAYIHVWQQIQNEDTVDASGLLTDLTGPVELCRAYLETRNEKGNARFILLLGDSGVGKTTAIQVMKSKPYGAMVFDIEASEVWKDKVGKGTAVPMLRALGQKLGLKDLPSGRDKLLNTLVENLQGKRRCLVIEEAHHLCPQGVNALKTLINLTPSIIVATAMPILWDKLSGSRAAWAECKQLTGNRLAERMLLVLQKEDVTKYLAANLTDVPGVDEKWLDRASARLIEEAPFYGNMRFVERVTKRFKREIRAGQDASLETMSNAIATEKKKR